jgi:hypothetical protein
MPAAQPLAKTAAFHAAKASQPPAKTAEPAPAAPSLAKTVALQATPSRTTTGRPAAPAKPKEVAPSEIVDVSSMGPQDEHEAKDEATKVRAPAPQMLRTLARSDATDARATAHAIIARERAAREAAREAAAGDPTVHVEGSPNHADEASALEAAARGAGTRPPYVDIHDGIAEPSLLGGTLMMARVTHAPGAKAHSSTLVMASPLAPGLPSAGSSRHASDWPAPTQAVPAAPVQAAPGMEGILGAHRTPPQGVPAVHLGPTAPSPQQPGMPFGRPSAEHALPPRSSVQAALTPTKTLPMVPIAIVLAVLALGGLGLGFFALRARHAVPTDPAGSASAPRELPQGASLTADPVLVPEKTAPAPVPTPAVIEDIDAAKAATAEALDAAPAVAPVAAPVTPPPEPKPVAQPSPFVAQQGLPVALAPPPPSAKPAADPNAFSESAARVRLGQANGILAFCKKEGGVTGPGNASVTFGLDGGVTAVAVDPPYAGTKEGECVASQFLRAKIPPFSGGPQTLRHSFVVPK